MIYNDMKIYFLFFSYLGLPSIIFKSLDMQLICLFLKFSKQIMPNKRIRM